MDQIIYLAFADNNKGSLPSLQKEADAIQRILFSSGRSNSFKPFTNFSATTENVAEDLKEFQEQMVVFHYSGHASGDRLLFEDKAGDPKGLAVLLSACPKLRLVFLNGCSTEDQVKVILDNSQLKAVIATSDPVPDVVAAEFAIYFYERLNFKGTSVREAFDVAGGFLDFRYGLDMEQRGLGLRSKKGGTPYCWTLHSSLPEAEDWSLDFRSGPDNGSQPLSIEEFLKKMAYSFEPIVATLLEIHRSDSPKKVATLREIVVEWEQFKATVDQIRKGDPFNHGRLIERIVSILPNPVGLSLKPFLKELKNSPSYYEKRHLQYTVDIFDSCMDLLVFSTLSQLWEGIILSGGKLRSSADLNCLKKFFLTNRREITIAEVIEILLAARRLFEKIADKDNKDKVTGDRFITEAYDLRMEYEIDSPLHKDIVFFNTLKTRLLNNQVADKDVYALFMDAQNHLQNFLSRINFILRYSLVTIKSIHVLRYRHRPHPAFDHKMAPLLFQDTFTYQAHSSNDFGLTQTVVLLKDLNCLKSNLPLSPFIFDKNVFFERSNESDLMVYCGYNPKRDCFIFQRIANPEETEEVTDVQFRVIKEQMDAFSEAVFGKPFKELS